MKHEDRMRVAEKAFRLELAALVRKELGPKRLTLAEAERLRTLVAFAQATDILRKLEQGPKI